MIPREYRFYVITFIITTLIILYLCISMAGAEEVSDWNRLIPAIIKVESNNDHHVIGANGEIGLMQISPIVFKEFIENNKNDDFWGNGTHPISCLLHPEINKDIGTWYLKRLKNHYLKDKYTLDRLLGAWNWGIGNVRKVNYDYDRFPPSVKQYIKKIKKYYERR